MGWTTSTNLKWCRISEPSTVVPKAGIYIHYTPKSQHSTWGLAKRKLVFQSSICREKVTFKGGQIHQTNQPTPKNGSCSTATVCMLHVSCQRQKELQANCHSPPCRDCKLKVANLQLSFHGWFFVQFLGSSKNGVMLNSLRVIGIETKTASTHKHWSPNKIPGFFLEQWGWMQSHHPVTPHLVGRKLVPIRPLPSQHPAVEVEMHPGKTAFRSRRQRWVFRGKFHNLAMNAGRCFLSLTFILLMEEILHHLLYTNPVNNGIFSISTGFLAGFLNHQPYD